MALVDQVRDPRELLASARRTFIETTPIDALFDDRPMLKSVWANRIERRTGRRIVFPVIVREHSVKSSSGADAFGVHEFEGYDTVNVETASPTIDAEFDIRELAVPMEVANSDLLHTTGPEQIVDLMSVRRQTVLEQLKASLENRIFNDNATGKKWQGLVHLIDNLDGVSVMGITPTAAPPANQGWKSKVLDAGGTPINKNMIRTLANNIKAAGGAADTCWLSQAQYENLQKQVDPQVLYNTSGQVEIGFPSFTFEGITFRWSPQCPDTDAFLISSKDFGVVVHPDSAMNVTEWAPLYNDTDSAKFVWRSWVTIAGNFFVRNRRRHGRIKNLVVS